MLYNIIVRKVNKKFWRYHDIEGDLILTIREDTFDTLRRKAFLKLEDRIIKLDKSMLGKKILLKEKESDIFYPLHEEDFETENILI